MTLRRYTKLIAAAAALTLAAAVPAVADPDPIDALTANVVVAPEVLVAPEVPEVPEDPEDGNSDSDDDDGAGGENAGDDGAGSGGVGGESELGGEGAGDPEVQESDGDSDISLLALPSEPTTITIANITDFHGRIDGPAERLACYVEDNPTAILTSSGDSIGATPFV